MEHKLNFVVEPLILNLLFSDCPKTAHNTNESIIIISINIWISDFTWQLQIILMNTMEIMDNRLVPYYYVHPYCWVNYQTHDYSICMTLSLSLRP
jgi:hypothetical protein